MASVGASGKKLSGHGARVKARSPAPTPADGGWGLVPHPVRVAPGQRFLPLHGGRRQFRVTNSLKNGRVLAVKADGRKERIELNAERLLAVNESGNGRHYRFIAYLAGRRYPTYAWVAVINAEAALLVLPEWHPRRPVRFPVRLIPKETRHPGTWLSCTADLGSTHGAALNLADLVACTDPGPKLCHRPTYRARGAVDARCSSPRGVAA